MVTTALSVAVAPPLEVTVSVAVNVPAAVYVWLGLTPLPELASPKV